MASLPSKPGIVESWRLLALRGQGRNNWRPDSCEPKHGRVMALLSVSPWVYRKGQGSPGATAIGEGELGPLQFHGPRTLTNRKAGYAGPRQTSGSFRGLSRRSGPRARPLPPYPSHRRRRRVIGGVKSNGPRFPCPAAAGAGAP